MVRWKLFVPFIFSIVYGSPDEYRLLSDLRHNYDPYERPVANSSDSLIVSVKIYLQQILDQQYLVLLQKINFL